MLWRRRNKKLDKRLNNVVETAEEARKSYRPKPRRVVIDTSFLDQQYQPGDGSQQIASDEVVQEDKAADPVCSQSGVEPDALHWATSENVDAAGCNTADTADRCDLLGDRQGVDNKEDSSVGDDLITLSAGAPGVESNDFEVVADERRTATSGEILDACSRPETVFAPQADKTDEADSLQEAGRPDDKSSYLSAAAVTEIAELREALKSLKQSLEEERAAHSAGLAEASTQPLKTGNISQKASTLQTDGLSTPELLSKVKEAVTRAQAAEERELESRRQEAEARKEALELQDKLDEIWQRNATVHAEKAELESKLATLNQDMVEKSKRLAELENTPEQLNKIIEEKDRLENAANQRCEDLETALKEQLAEFEESFQSSNEQLEGALKNAERLQQKLSDSEARAGEAERAREHEAQARERAVKLADRAQSDLTRVEEILERTTEKLAREKSDKTAQEEQLADVKLKVNGLERQLAASQKALVETQNKAEAAELDANQTIEEHRRKLKNTEDDAAERSAEYDLARDKILDLEQQLAISRASVVAAEGELAKAQAEIATLYKSADADSTLRDDLDMLKEDLQSARAGEESLTRELAEERSKSVDISAKFKSALNDVAELEERLCFEQGAAQDLSCTNKRNLEARDAAEAKADQLARELAESENETNNLRAARDSLALELNQVRAEVKELQNSLADAQKAMEKAADAGGDNVQREADLKVRIKALEDQLAFAKSGAIHADLVRAELDKEVRDLRQELDTARAALRSKAIDPPTRANEPDLRFAADKPVFVKANKAANTDPKVTNQSPPASGAAPSHAVGAADRKTGGVATSLAGTIQKDTELTVLDCRVIQRSSDSAKIDIVPDKINASIGMPVVGDRLTLTIKTAWDTTSVPCEVAWLDGIHCGLTFIGPPATLVDKSKKSAKKTSNTNKSEKAKRTSNRRKSAWT